MKLLQIHIISNNDEIYILTKNLNQVTLIASGWLGKFKFGFA